MNLSSRFWSALFMVISFTPMCGVRFERPTGDSCPATAKWSNDPVFVPPVEGVVGADCSPGLSVCLPEALPCGDSKFLPLLLPASCNGGGANPGGAEGDPDQECGDVTPKGILS
mmetsp:Transcript_7280/g.16483  ORF Transcript_7280/g.16483 Transcript_7280/m.16483 type:complete len:114 (-) Transcript_7280:1271-1612(-)